MTDLLKPGEYFEFTPLLAAIEQDLKVEEVRFYATYMRTDSLHSPAEQLMVQAQKKFFDSAKNHPKVIFYEGHFSGSGKEKGVDVRLAVDMVYLAATGAFSEAVIMTGDADLTYAVEMVRAIGLPVHLSAFGSRFPLAISFKANKRFVFDWRGFFTEKALPTYRKPPRYLTVRDVTDKLPILDTKRPDA